MIVPSGMTEQQVIDQITIVVDRIAPKYTFYGYSADDMKQEAFILCMDALDRYTAGRPLENFLSSHLSNRLKNFVRDNHFQPDEHKKGAILRPAQLDHEHTILDNSEHIQMQDELIDYSVISELIDVKMPPDMRMDYLKMVNDVYIPRRRREEVVGRIHDILADHEYEVDDEKGQVL